MVNSPSGILETTPRKGHFSVSIVDYHANTFNMPNMSHMLIHFGK